MNGSSLFEGFAVERRSPHDELSLALRVYGLLPLKRVSELYGAETVPKRSGGHVCGDEQVAHPIAFPVLPCVRPAHRLTDLWASNLAGERWDPYWVTNSLIVHKPEQIPAGYRNGTLAEAVFALIFNSRLGSVRVSEDRTTTVQVYVESCMLKIVRETDEAARRGPFPEEGPTHHLLLVSNDGVVH